MEPNHPVLLNIYDMYWTNQYTTALGVGVFHTGIEVHGVEFAYGGHPFEFSGIFEITPKDSDDLGEHYKYKETVHLGYTNFTKEEVKQAVTHLGRDFKGISYHLMSKNCNHFSKELCQLLCGKEPPNWVNRLAYVSSCIPFVERIIPKEWLTPCALEESVKLTAEGRNGSVGSSNNPSNPSSSRGSVVGSGNGGGLTTFLEMIRGGGNNSNSSNSNPSSTSNGNGIVASLLSSCGNGTRKSSTSSETSLHNNSPPASNSPSRQSIASTTSSKHRPQSSS